MAVLTLPFSPAAADDGDTPTVRDDLAAGIRDRIEIDERTATVPGPDALRERVRGSSDTASSGSTAPRAVPTPLPRPADPQSGSTTASGATAAVDGRGAHSLRDEVETIRREAEATREELEARGERLRAASEGQRDDGVRERLDSIRPRVRDRTDAIGAGKIVVCKIVAGTRGDGAGLCGGRPGSLLAGAVFELRDPKGAVLDTCTSRRDGSCTFVGLPFGTYHVVEVAAPAGYRLDTTPRTVTPSREVLRPRVFVENAPLPDPEVPVDPPGPGEPPDPPGPGEPPDPPGPGEPPPSEPPTPGPEQPDPTDPSTPDPGPEDPPVGVLPEPPVDAEPEEPETGPSTDRPIAADGEVQRVAVPETAVLGLVRTGASISNLLLFGALTLAFGLAATRRKPTGTR